MRTLIVAMGLAAIAATPALAQTGLARATSSNNAGATTSGTGGTTTGTTTSTTTTLPSTSVGSEPVLTAPAPAASRGSTVAGGGNAFGTNVTTTDTTGTVDNPSADIGADSGSLGRGRLGAPILVPEGNVSVIGGGTAGPGLVAVPAAGAQQAPSVAASNTPIFDQAAREGRAREAARRARGEQPRVFGIAPNTERDLTWQMPDDRIIRY